MGEFFKLNSTRRRTVTLICQRKLFRLRYVQTVKWCCNRTYVLLHSFTLQLIPQMYFQAYVPGALTDGEANFSIPKYALHTMGGHVWV